MPIELRLAQLGTSPELERYLAMLRQHGAFPPSASLSRRMPLRSKER